MDDRWQGQMEVRVEALSRRLDDAQASATKALDAALQANEKRLDLLNEFRAQAEDQQADFVRVEKFDGLADRVAKNESTLAGLLGRIAAFAAVAALVGGSLVSLLLNSFH